MSLKDALKKKIKNLKSADELEYVERLSTGIARLDVLTGGGLPKGRVIQIWGAESVGKSSLTLSIIKNVLLADPEAEAIYADAEETVNKGDIEAHGLDEVSDRLLFFTPVGGEEAIDTVLDAFQAGATIGVIDSVPMLRPLKVLQEINKDSSYKDVSGIANFLERVQSKIVNTLHNTNGILIFINQERPAKSMYEAPSHPGGSALKFMLSMSIHINSASKDKDTPGLITQNIVIRKNKTFIPMLRGSIPMYTRVVQLANSLAEVASDVGVIEKKGGGNFYLPEDVCTKYGVNKHIRGIDNVAGVIGSHPELYNELYALAVNKAVEAASPDMEEFDEDELTDVN